MGSKELSEDERRGADRLTLDLPVRGRVGDGEYHDLAVVDISPGGMQISSSSFDALKLGFDPKDNVARFEIRIVARLAWAQPGDDGAFLTGWEFDSIESDGPMIG
ncbi:MAG: PilZ domain-containing protein [bacterium]|nr:PilZ domain-containing protein [bacterium]